MMSGNLFYPIRQNVLWTFLIALSLMVLHQRAKAKGTLLNILVGALGRPRLHLRFYNLRGFLWGRGTIRASLLLCEGD